MTSVFDAPVGNADRAVSAIPAAAAEGIARWRTENATLRQAVAALTAQGAELERRLGRNRSHSGQPPSSDGLKRPPPGGQTGHPGETLRPVAEPSVLLDHVPERCRRCGSALAPEMSTASSARQVFDRPEPEPLVGTEHRAHSGQCGEITRAAFSDGVTAPAP